MQQSLCKIDCIQDAVGDLLGGMAGPGIRATNGRRQRIMQSRGTRALGESQAVAAIAAGPAAPSSQHRYYMQRVTACGLPHRKNLGFISQAATVSQIIVAACPT